MQTSKKNRSTTC